jgi:hypothetical protein
VIRDRRLSSRFSLLNGARRLNESRSPGGFPTTHWSRVARAGEPGGADAIEALAELFLEEAQAAISRLTEDSCDVRIPDMPGLRRGPGSWRPAQPLSALSSACGIGGPFRQRC